ncbi:hypothetical protein APR04_000549 [Promicromonospora umidemergens]|uniref:Uncharacterized protein n=1 Tax=Promicromonospora umidemergens TaxID=629679 RepID=A0ABP8XA97_9MICO|nr:hypothetical protein [Promicromonospora umidemergens]MCP2281660.1 hypothetical protein [Promicromonospora umidemergens]
MSAARVGEWQLLDHDDDPVPAEASGLDAVIRHYKAIAGMMTTQAALLKKIGEGDESLLKGESADAIREKAGESHERLGAVAGRYDDVHAALKEYQPALETARSETGAALRDAEAAADKERGAEGMADPVNADRPDDAKPLTDGEKQDSRDRENAIAGAKADLGAAKAKCQAALATLQAAADRAATKIKENWGDDGLGHSGWEAFLHKALKWIVEILGWIGMALAILAMLVPGLQFLATLALGVALVGLLGSTVLAIAGESSWVNVIFGVLGVLTLGMGKVAMNLAKAGQTFMNMAKNFATRIPNFVALMKGLPNISKIFSGGGFAKMLQNIKLPPLRLGGAGGLGSVTTKVVSSSWGSFFSKVWDKIKISPGDWAIIRNPGKFWTFNDMVGLPDMSVLKHLSIFGRMGLPGFATITPFVWAMGPLNFFWGFASAAIPAIMAPSDIFADSDSRGDWAWAEWDEEHNISPALYP